MLDHVSPGLVIISRNEIISMAYFSLLLIIAGGFLLAVLIKPPRSIKWPAGRTRMVLSSIIIPICLVLLVTAVSAAVVSARAESTDDLINIIRNDRNSEHVAQAAQEIAERMDPALTEKMANIVKGTDGGTKAMTVVQDYLLARSADSDPATRIKALDCLAALKYIVPVNDALLKDTDVNVRNEAARLIGQVKSESSVPALIEALTKDERFVDKKTVIADLKGYGDFEAEYKAVVKPIMDRRAAGLKSTYIDNFIIENSEEQVSSDADPAVDFNNYYAWVLKPLFTMRLGGIDTQRATQIDNFLIDHPSALEIRILANQISTPDWNWAEGIIMNMAIKNSCATNYYSTSSNTSCGAIATQIDAKRGDANADVAWRALMTKLSITHPGSYGVLALRNRDTRGVTDNHDEIIKLGYSQTIPLLVQALNDYGDQAMGEDFLNCGNATLKQAATEWGAAHGLIVVSNTGGSGGSHPRWGNNG